MSKKKVVIIAGGGTGGHIYPGIALAKAFVSQNPSTEIHFVGSHGGLEEKIVPREKFPLHLVSSGKLNMNGNLILRLKTLFKIPLGFVQSIILLIKLKPKYVVGVGGYASGPFVLMAAILGFNTSLWEANAHPGMANRWLSRFVDHCFIVFEEAKKYLNHKKPFIAGMPLRSEIDQFAENVSVKEVNGERPFRILSFGGSQGARAINYALCEMLLAHPELKGQVEVVHQTGSLDYKVIEDKYKKSEIKIDQFEFIYNMPDYYQWADLLVCRGGASTIAEAAAFGVPSIVIPLPLADAHQQKNAESLVSHQAGVMLLQKDLSSERLFQEIMHLKQNAELRLKMSHNIRQFYVPKATEKIVKEIISPEA